MPDPASYISTSGVIGMFLYLLWTNGHLPFFKGGESMSANMRHLREHYNDETTPLLTEIRDGIRDISRKFEEYDKFGIPTRECKKQEK